MAKPNHIKSSLQALAGTRSFAAALRIIDDAANQGKRPFAESLRKILDASARPDYRAAQQPGLTTLASQIDPPTDIIDEIAVARSLNDIVLNSDCGCWLRGSSKNAAEVRNCGVIASRFLLGCYRRKPFAASSSMAAAVQRRAIEADRHRFTLRQTRRTVLMTFSTMLVHASAAQGKQRRSS
jgi:hypothetical protein